MSQEAYITRHAACGKIMAAIVDNPQHKREVAKEVGNWIRSGDSVERMELEQVRKQDFCTCYFDRD